MTGISARTRIKMCGITRAVDLHGAVGTGADAVGFVLYDKSPRAVVVQQAVELAALLPPFVTPVLLFVNPDANLVSQAVAQIPHAMLQFHGDESADFCESFSRPYIRAVRISHDAKSDQLVNLLDKHHHPKASALLLDSESPQYGGSGTSFDWSVLPACIDRYVVLSGGLHADNVQLGIRAVAPRCRTLAVDVSSGIEVSKGIKDLGKMQAFARAVNEAPR